MMGLMCTNSFIHIKFIKFKNKYFSKYFNITKNIDII